MTKSFKGGHKKGGNKKSQNAKFQKKEYNAPLKYKSEASVTRRKKVKISYHVGINSPSQFYNEPINQETEEKSYD